MYSVTSAASFDVIPKLRTNILRMKDRKDVSCHLSFAVLAVSGSYFIVGTDKEKIKERQVSLEEGE
jgi:hypothetical protein